MLQTLDTMSLGLAIGVKDLGKMHQMVIHAQVEIIATFLHDLYL